MEFATGHEYTTELKSVEFIQGIKPASITGWEGIFCSA
jgi:hypothetical protein